MGIAYMLSLVFALGYGYIAAYHRRAESVMIAAARYSAVHSRAELPAGRDVGDGGAVSHRQIGVELGSIILIFTGQVWNIAFSFYSSLKSIPRELREAAAIYRFGRWQRFIELELPFGVIGLVWNSIVSVAGGWFFLMACEMFVLGKRDFRLPGLGSYLQTAASPATRARILWGLAAMVAVIVLLDQLIWRPAIAWSEQFKFEQVESVAKADLRPCWICCANRRCLSRSAALPIAGVGAADVRSGAPPSAATRTRSRSAPHGSPWLRGSLPVALVVATASVLSMR